MWFMRTVHVILLFGVMVPTGQVREEGSGAVAKTEMFTVWLLPPIATVITVD